MPRAIKLIKPFPYLQFTITTKTVHITFNFQQIILGSNSPAYKFWEIVISLNVWHIYYN